MGEDILDDAVISVVSWLICCFQFLSFQVIMNSLFCAC